MQRRQLLTVLVLASLVNSFPALLPLGGDMLFHRTAIHCFATQFWQGDLYPRWCMESNRGLGAPIFMFYFPLAYFISALLWPITGLGADSLYVYAAGCFIATLLTGLTCYAWLKDIVAPRYALAASIAFLFMPYRMELTSFRNAYSELWGLVFVPLLFKYTRRIIMIPSDNTMPLALSFALLLLAHVPLAMVAALGSGLYFAIMGWSRWRLWGRYAAAMALGAAMAAFYLLPALYYKQFINAHQPYMPWADTFFSLSVLLQRDQPRFALFTTAYLFITLAMIARWLWQSRWLKPVLQREMAAWGCAAIMALFLLFPISSPLYDRLAWLHQVLLPWRMLNLFGLCAAFMLAVWLQWLMPPARRRFWKADSMAALMLLALFDLLVVGVHTGHFQEEENRQLAAHYVRFADQYQTRWTPDSHYTMRYLMDAPRRKQSVSVVSGSGHASILYWGWDGIRLESDAKTPLTLHLSHMYFPIWRVRDEQGQMLRLTPDPASGEMLLDIPAGKHTVMMRRAIFVSMPWTLRLTCLGSAALLVMVLGMQLMRKRPHA